MKKSKRILAAILFSVSLLSLTLFSCACNNVGYEIETAEDEGPAVTPVDSDNPNPTAVQNTQKTDNSNVPSSTNEDNTKEKSNKRYTIQIGAFSNEQSAEKLSDKAKSSLDFDVDYAKVGDFYKIRVGVFSSISDAQTALDEVRQQGFNDSFISEIK